MSLNLHAAVRGAINTLNPEYEGVWRSSSGYTTSPSGARTPTFVDTAASMRVQALSGRDLKHTEFLNMQGVKRSVYMFGNVQGVVRPDVKGGDILQFPQNRGGSNCDWLVVVVLETWTPDVAGWCKVGAVLQGPSPL